MKTHHVNMNPPYVGAGYNDNRLFVKGYSIHFSVDEIKPGESGRQEMGGKVVPGPWAYVYGKATVIDNHGGTKRDIEEEKARGVLVDAEVGDILEINGRKYTIERSSDPHYPKLRQV